VLGDTCADDGMRDLEDQGLAGEQKAEVVPGVLPRDRLGAEDLERERVFVGRCGLGHGILHRYD